MKFLTCTTFVINRWNKSGLRRAGFQWLQLPLINSKRSIKAAITSINHLMGSTNRLTLSIGAERQTEQLVQLTSPIVNECNERWPIVTTRLERNDRCNDQMMNSSAEGRPRWGCDLLVRIIISRPRLLSWNISPSLPHCLPPTAHQGVKSTAEGRGGEARGGGRRGERSNPFITVNSTETIPAVTDTELVSRADRRRRLHPAAILTSTTQNVGGLGVDSLRFIRSFSSRN